MNEPKRVRIIGVDISAVNKYTTIEYLFNNIKKAKGNYICAANVHTTVTAYEKEDFRNIQNDSFLTLPDGKPLSVIGKKRGYSDIDRVTGPDFFESILKKTENSSYKHFFYGNTKENLNSLMEVIAKKYPKLSVSGYEPSVFRELLEEEENKLVKRVNETNTDFVWVSLGAPRQEILCNKLCNKTNAIWIGVGGAFNIVSGTIPRAPKQMQDLGLEWLYRLYKEPRRLFKRYLVTNSKFIWYLIKERVNEK